MQSMLNSNGENGHPCLVPDFRGNAFNFSPLRIMFAVGLSYIAFIMLRYVPSIPAFFKFLAMSHGLQDLSSPTRDQTHILGSESHWIARECPGIFI